MDKADKINTLLKQLDAQRDAYQNTFRLIHETLAKDIAATVPSGGARPAATSPLPSLSEVPRSPRTSVSHAASDREGHARKSSTGLATITTSSESRRTGDDSDSDDDESLYVSDTLEPQIYTEETLRQHLQSYKWNYSGAKILETVVDSPSRLLETPLITRRKGAVEDRSHLSHYQVFDIGQDGAPLSVDFTHVEREASRAQAIWHSLKEINQPPKERLAVGRITVIREPSPILFGAVHHAFNDYLDVNEIFKSLVDVSSSSASVHRAFDDDVRKQRSFVFNFEYFTIVGTDCKPMKWQMADNQEQQSAHHIPVTRCSAVVALVLNGPHVRKVRNPSRRANNTHGYAYDPWSSWQVLNLQCYPDWNASMDVHDSSKHYVNGPEAFLVTVLGELRDAQKRLEHIYREITKLITPPLEFMFDSEYRDRLLFEDRDFTYSRRYFWASQTLGLVNDSIRSMVDAYEDNFTDEVWDGTHKTLWPLLEQESARSVYYKKRMASLRTKFQAEIRSLRKQVEENDERRREIQGLKEELFTGTSIRESRISVENTEITIQQGHNIKLLTLLSILFLPLTFVTSVFGMTNMPTERHYWAFGLVTATVCVPFFVLVGSLNTTSGMRFWRHKTGEYFKKVGGFLAWLFGCIRRKTTDADEVTLVGESESKTLRPLVPRSTSEQVARDARLRRWSTGQNGDPAKQSVEIQEPGSPGVARVRRDVARSQSRLVEMLGDERKRTLRYSPNV